MSDSLQAALNEIVYIVRSSSLKRKYFVYGPTAQISYDRKELWEMIKNDSDIYARIVADTGLAESAIEERVFKLFLNVPSVDVDEDVEVSGDADKCSLHIPYSKLPVHTTPHPTPPCPTLPHPTPPFPTLPHPTSSYPTLPNHTLPHPTPSYESADESKGPMEGVVQKFNKFSSVKDMKMNKVRVENFSIKEKVEDCEAFLKTFKKIVSVERIVSNKKSHRVYDVAFEDRDCANDFYAIKKLKYKKTFLRKKLLYSCSHCSKSYISYLCLKSHVSKEHDGNQSECSDCGKVFSRRKYMEAHKLQQHRDSELVCISCNKRFRSGFGLVNHKKLGGACSHQCSECLKTFTRKNDMEKHKKICESVRQPGGTCSICCKSFELQCDLELHRKKITNLYGSYKYVCRHCGKVFCDFLSRENHIRFERHKIGDGLRKIKELFPCEKCGIELDSKENLFCHMEMHIDRKSRTKHASDCPKCDHCHSVFTVKRSLDRHMLLVHDEHGRPKYRCEDCDKTFCTGKQLETHNKQTHTDHICTSCEQRFTTKRALEHHQKKQETFYCSVCEKKFCNKKTFYGHVYNHKVK